MRCIPRTAASRQVESDADSQAPIDDQESELPLGLDRELWHDYQDLALFDRAMIGQRYHVTEYDPTTKRYAKNVHRPERADGGKLTHAVVQRHVEGKCIVFAVWPKYVNRIVIDLDRKTADTATHESMCERLVAVSRAFGRIPAAPPSTGSLVAYENPVDVWNRHASTMPGILVQSSNGERREGKRGGIHWMIPLDGYYDGAETRRVVVALLGGLVYDGHIEVWPAGEKALRLPFGRGSLVVDKCTLEPPDDQRIAWSPRVCRHCERARCKPECAGIASPSRKIDAVWEVDDHGDAIQTFVFDAWRRDVGADVAAWKMATSEPVSFASLQTRALEHVTNEATATPKKEATATPKRRKLPKQRAGSHLEHLPAPVQHPGERNERWRDLICGWYCGGLTRRQVTERATAWLDQPGHVGSLSGVSGSVIREAMLRHLPSELDRLDRKLATGALQRRGESRALNDAPRAASRPDSHAASRAFPYSRLRRAHAIGADCPDEAQAGPRTRHRLLVEQSRAMLTRADRERIDLESDRWLRERLIVFVADLRAHLQALEDLDMPRDRIAISRFTLQRIAGVRRPKSLAHGDCSPYRVLIDAAARLGFIGPPLFKGKRGESATIYATAPLSDSM